MGRLLFIQSVDERTGCCLVYLALNGTMLAMLNDFYQNLDPVALAFGPFEVRWYGLAYVLGFICAGVLIYRAARCWKLKIDPYDVLTFVCACAIGIIVGARIGYCVVYGNGYYFEHPLEFLAINKGGMSFHGGLVGAVVAGIIYSVVMKIPVLTMADLVGCSAPIGLFFGRCANFINGELYGAVTDAPWGVDFTGSGVMYQPSQLYEAFLEGLVLLLVMRILVRLKPTKPQGFFIGVFLVLYGLFRIAIEFVRLPDSQIGYFFGTWGTMGQALCLPMVIFGIALIVYALKTRHEQCFRA